ncbi:MAG: SDR family NAD(P)-dependent oxidoreductase, partial [Steroidobacteraceae bacterium]
MDTLTGRTAFVTGGASGFGFALAAALLDEGMRVVIADLDAGALEVASRRLAANGANVSGVICDVADRESVRGAA